jgi:hypothetical protein
MFNRELPKLWNDAIIAGDATTCQIFWVRSEDRLSLYLLSSELTLIGTKTAHWPGVF